MTESQLLTARVRALHVVDPSASLAENEAIIERCLTTFVEVGDALARIRDRRQYRGAAGAP